MQEAGSHLRVAMHARYIGKTLGLYLTGTDNPLADGCTGFARLAFGKLFERHGDNFHLDINPIEQRTGDAVQVFLYLSGSAYTMAGGMIVVPAWRVG